MLRALRNLGHTVLHVDTKRTRQTLQAGHVDFSSGARGGYGPIYLRLAPLEPILERFAPADHRLQRRRAVLSPRATPWRSSRRGILLLGITLSDPDVFASVVPGASTFDYHTTNARQALAMYRAAGVRNTMWLPFGIDRDYILADVPDAPELAADVICLGHAKGRPERNETMQRVAERHDVRVYGTGWELPGAEVVRDERQMQAARNGRIHVNFALTRAAYVNVKCGVFEAIASGGVVCTSRFEEMEHFFEYGREIVEFADADDLVAVLDELLGDPARLEAIRRAAFQRLVRRAPLRAPLAEAVRRHRARPAPARRRDPHARAGGGRRRDARGRRARRRAASSSPASTAPATSATTCCCGRSPTASASAPAGRCRSPSPPTTRSACASWGSTPSRGATSSGRATRWRTARPSSSAAAASGTTTRSRRPAGCPAGSAATTSRSPGSGRSR